MRLDPSALKHKIRYQYIERQREKLNADPVYVYLSDTFRNVVNLTAQPIVFMNGTFETQTETTQIQIKEQINDFIRTHYPILHHHGELPGVRHQPYDDIYIEHPSRLPLGHIDGRLELFSDYLDYRMPFIAHSCDKRDFLNYNEWLYMRSYDALVKIDWDGDYFNPLNDIWGLSKQPEHGRFNCNGDYIWPNGEVTRKEL